MLRGIRRGAARVKTDWKMDCTAPPTTLAIQFDLVQSMQRIDRGRGAARFFPAAANRRGVREKKEHGLQSGRQEPLRPLPPSVRPFASLR
jgi:hypothetical protein